MTTKLTNFLAATAIMLLPCQIWAQTLFVPNGTSGIGTVTNSTANVGVGIDNPLEKLHINGAVRGNGKAGVLRVQTDYGYLDLGAQNASRTHIYTDRAGIEFNKDIYLNTKMITSNAGEIEFHNVVTTSGGQFSSSYNITPLQLIKGDAKFNGNVTLTSGRLILDRGNMNLAYGKWITIGSVNPDPYSGVPLVDSPRLALHHNGIHAYVDFIDNMHFRAGQNWCPLSLYGDGTVGIGFGITFVRGIYKTQGYKLAVNGGILCESVKIIADVPDADYVFEADYNLMPLNDLERYVTREKHLPDIPSAEEFKTNGYTVGGMDEMLLRKVEELTLYLIEQNKKMEALQQELNQLKAAAQQGE